MSKIIDINEEKPEEITIEGLQRKIKILQVKNLEMEYTVGAAMDTARLNIMKDIVCAQIQHSGKVRDHHIKKSLVIAEKIMDVYKAMTDERAKMYSSQVEELQMKQATIDAKDTIQ